jgi:hypothetical protein
LPSLKKPKEPELVVIPADERPAYEIESEPATLIVILCADALFDPSIT